MSELSGESLNLILNRIDASDRNTSERFNSIERNALANNEVLHEEINKITNTVNKVEHIVDINTGKLDEHVKSTEANGFVASLKRYWAFIVLLLFIGRLTLGLDGYINPQTIPLNASKSTIDSIQSYNSKKINTAIFNKFTGLDFTTVADVTTTKK